MTADDYIKKGYGCMAQDDISTAIEYFQAALQSAPDNEEAKMCLFIAYNRQGNPQYAKDYHNGKNSTDNILPLGISFIKWHKEQVIEKWKRVFSAALANYLQCDSADLIDDTDVICYQLIMSRLKQKSYSKDKSAYYYLAHPLYCKNKSTKLPLLTGYLEVKKEKNNRPHFFPESSDDITVRSLEYGGEEYVSTDKFGSIVHQYFQGDNLLEKTEYEYYSLWAHHYLGLWQWEQWHPFASIKDVVGRRHEIMGVDEEMHEIASTWNNKASESGADIFSIVEFDELAKIVYESSPQFLNKPYIKSITIEESDNSTELSPLQMSKGNYGNYFVGLLKFEDDGKSFASVAFGSNKEQQLLIGNRVDILFSHSELKDGACIIV